MTPNPKRARVPSDHDGAPSGNLDTNDAFKFLTRVVNDSLTRGDSSGGNSSALSEAELRKMEQPLMGIMCLLGVGAFAPYGMVPGLQLAAPSGRQLALDTSTWLKAWGFEGGKWSRGLWTRLGHRLSLAKLAAPLCICLVIAVLPENLALQAFEICLAHRSKLSQWSDIEIPEEGALEDETRMAKQTGLWLKECGEVYKELKEFLDSQFEPEDSSVYLERWISLHPSDCSSWTSLCARERKLYAELDALHPGACPWSLRLDRLCSYLSQYRRLKDDIGLRSSLLSELKSAKDITSFDDALDEWRKDYHPLTLDQVLGPPVGRKSEDSFKNSSKGQSSSSQGQSQKTTNKSKLCRYFSKTGKCKYADKCKYAHGPKSEGQSTDSKKSVKAEDTSSEEAVRFPRGVCREFQKQGKCSYGASCKFSHDDPPLRRSERLQGQVEPKKDGSSVAVVSTEHTPIHDPVELPLVCASVNVAEGQVVIPTTDENDDLLYVQAQICLDSGSQVNLVSKTFVDRHGLVGIREDKPFRLRGITGDSITVDNVLVLRVSIGNLYSDVKFGIVDTLPHGADLLLNHQCSQKLRIPVAPPCEDKSWEDIDKVILENVSPEWEPIEAAPGFSIRLRELSEGEAKECPSQRFCFDVSVSPLDDPNDARHNINDSPWPSNVVDFGFKIYNRLSASEKESYDKAVNKFVDAGYWVPVDDDVVSHDSTAPKVVSFPVKQVDDSASDGPTKVTSFKVRPVIQAVGVNRVIKAGGARKASYSGDSVAEILLGLRLNFSRAGEGPLGLLSLDVGKAFYRFRLMARSDSRGDVVSSLGYLYIRAAGKWYRCDRLAFGLLHGPASLQSGLATLLRLAGKLDPSLAVLPVYSFYDDIMVPIPLTKVPELLSTILPLAERVGLVIPSDQIALLSDAAERICGITCDHGWGLRLGNLMRVRQNDLQIRCLVKKIDFVKNFELKADKTTRRDVSRLTGSAQASNILRLHPVRALASSAVSKIVARIPPRGEWDSPLMFSEDCASYRDLKHVIDLLKAELLKKNCIHSSVVRNATHLELYCDASQYNYGYQISIGGCILASVSKLWPNGAESWHSNRRELYCLYQGVAHVDDVVRASRGWLKTVTCHSDNSGVVAWLRSGCPGSKGVERPSIRRLVSTVKDLARDWTTFYSISTSFNFVNGSSNSTADTLSRLSYDLGITAALGQHIDQPIVLVTAEVGDEDASNDCPVKVELSDKFISDVKLRTDWFRHSPDTDNDEVWVGESLSSILVSGVPDKLSNRLHVLEDEDGVLLTVSLKSLGSRIYVPPDSDTGQGCDLRSQLLRRAHDTAIGHVGVAGMSAALKPVVWWPTIAGDIARFVRNCLGCAREHARHIAPCGYSEVVRSRRWDTVYIDFCGPIDGWTYTCPSSNTIIRPASVFVIIDTLTGWVELCPCADQTAHTASRLLLERWISRFGIPNEIRSDRDQAFLSSIQSSICRLLNIDQVFSGGLSPASQGVVESAVRSLKRHLERSFTTDLTLLPWLQRSLNAARKSHAGALPVSPEILLYGESTSGGLESLLCASSDAFPKFNPDTLTKEVKDTVEVFCRAWSEDLAIQRAKRVDRLNADGNLAQLQELAPGDTVFRVTKNGLGRTKATGPFIFESMDGNMVRLSGIRHAIPLHQVRLCSVTPTGNLGCCPDPPDPHGLLAGPRRDLKEGSLVLFVTPEWETTDDGSELEITAYDVGKLVKNDYPNMSIQRFYIDESGRWKDWKNPETVNVHSSQVIASISLTSRGKLSAITKSRLSQAGIPIE